MYRSPLPPAEELAAYERAYPGIADRIIAMAERDQQAEIQEVRFQQRAKLTVDMFGQLFLFGLVASAVLLALNDKPLEAFFAGLAPIAIAIYANTRKKTLSKDDENS
jgi:uncharacterized membrane protein